MLKDEIKKANINAIKNKDANARALYSVVLNKIMLEEVKRRGSDKPVEDGDILNILNKTMKELDEEKLGYQKVNNTERVTQIAKQQELLQQFLPKMMSRDEIKTIILALPDKNIGVVMKEFKAKYNGLCDMKIVKEILDELK